MPSREKRFIQLREKVDFLVKQNAVLLKSLQGLQPVVVRLVGGYLILEKKGLFTNAEFQAITQKDADGFLEKAIAGAPKQVQDKPDGAGTVENNTGDSGSGVSGAESIREPVPSPEAYERPEEGTIPDGVQGIRTPDGGDNKPDPVSSVTPADGSPGS